MTEEGRAVWPCISGWFLKLYHLMKLYYSSCCRGDSMWFGLQGILECDFLVVILKPSGNGRCGEGNDIYV